jgi:hypothetical protein
MKSRKKRLSRFVIMDMLDRIFPEPRDEEQSSRSPLKTAVQLALERAARDAQAEYLKNNPMPITPEDVMEEWPDDTGEYVRVL